MVFRRLLFEMLIRIIEAMTPELRAAFCRLLKELEGKAKETKSPVDDAIVFTLKGLFACDKE